MIEGYGPVTQALLGTLLTWGLTAAGAALVFIFTSGKRKILDGSLGFAAGVMLAASYWSLLAPAIEMAQISGSYGAEGQYAFIPVSIGFFLGAFFVYGADVLMPWLGITSPNTALALQSHEKVHSDDSVDMTSVSTEQNDAYWLRETTAGNPVRPNAGIQGPFNAEENSEDFHSGVTQRKKPSNLLSTNTFPNGSGDITEQRSVQTQQSQVTWKRILLLIVAITIHNIPEGLAVGVGFGAIGKTPSATLESARNLAFGIGIQNFPEGLAVSLPLRGSGYSTWKSFWYGQLSGMVEPIAGLFGAVAVVIAEPLLPYALAFAAGAMVYVVVDDIIPEAQTSGNGLLASWGVIVGFIVMMSLDVGLG